MIFQAYEMEQRIGVLEWNYKRQVDKKIKCLIAPLMDKYSQDIYLSL